MNISVIIPVYNVEKYIERCLRSIMNQTFTDGVECILVNDCTPDDSIKIAKELICEYKGNILFKILSHKHNKGSAVARNTGLAAATGTYIQYIDSDDYIEPTMLEGMYNMAVETKADIVISDYWETFKGHENYIHQEAAPTIKMLNLLLEGKTGGYLWNKLFKRSIYVENHIQCLEGADYWEDLRICIYCIIYSNNIVHLPKAFVHYVQYNSASYSASRNIKNNESCIKNITDISNLLIQTNFFKVCQSSFYNRCIVLKFHLLLHSSGTLQKSYNQLFKDANQNIFKAPIGRLGAIALWGASKNGLSLFNFLRYVWIKFKKIEIQILH